MPTETVTTNGRVAPEDARGTVRSREDDALRALALRHRESVRKFKLYLSVYVVSMLVLTPVWVVTQYEIQDGWLKHLSTRSRYPGDWDPWIIWVALIGAVIVAVTGIRASLDRPTTEEELDREVEPVMSVRR